MSQPLTKRIFGEWRMDSIGLAILLALTGLAYCIEISPAMRDREALRAGSALLTQKRETISHLQQTLHNVNAQIAALQVAQASELKLQPPSQINDRLSDLSTIAGDCGLVVEAIEPGETLPSVRYSTVPIRINGRGTYPQFVQFIHALRAKLPDTSVTDVNLSGGGTDISANFTINVLWHAALTPVVVKNEMQ